MMKIENCPKCGGTHFGSYECPFTDDDLRRMGRKSDDGQGKQGHEASAGPRVVIVVKPHERAETAAAVEAMLEKPAETKVIARKLGSYRVHKPHEKNKQK